MEMDLADEECALYPLSHSETDEEGEPEHTPMLPPHANLSSARLIELWTQTAPDNTESAQRSNLKESGLAPSSPAVTRN